MTMRVLLAVLGLAIAVPAGAQAPRRVITVNLCLDQMALRLAAPGQLVGVSYLARDPRISVLAEQARDVPAVRARVESILDRQPDLVIFDRDAHAAVKRLVRMAGVPILEVPWAASLEESQSLIREIARALGRKAEGEALVQEMLERQRALVRPAPPEPLAAVLQANRGTAGRGSLYDELLHLAGYRNLAAELGIPAYGRLPIEAVLAGRPDLLVLDGDANRKPARATEFVDHQALASLAGKAKLVSIPLKYSICAGPENIEVLRRLAEARR